MTVSSQNWIPNTSMSWNCSLRSIITEPMCVLDHFFSKNKTHYGHVLDRFSQKQLRTAHLGSCILWFPKNRSAILHALGSLLKSPLNVWPEVLLFYTSRTQNKRAQRNSVLIPGGQNTWLKEHQHHSCGSSVFITIIQSKTWNTRPMVSLSPRTKHFHTKDPEKPTMYGDVVFHAIVQIKSPKSEIFSCSWLWVDQKGPMLGLMVFPAAANKTKLGTKVCG